MELKKTPVEIFIKTVKNKVLLCKPKAVKCVEFPELNGKTRPLGIKQYRNTVCSESRMHGVEYGKIEDDIEKLSTAIYGSNVDTSKCSMI